MGHLRPSNSNRAPFMIFCGQKESGSVLNIITVHGTNKWYFYPTSTCGGEEALPWPLRSLIPLCLYPPESEQMESGVLKLPFFLFHFEYIL